MSLIAISLHYAPKALRRAPRAMRAVLRAYAQGLLATGLLAVPILLTWLAFSLIAIATKH